jgi:hypothetical protein
MPVSAKTLQTLSIQYEQDARLLLSNRRHGAANQLIGLALETAFKAVIAKHMLAETIPDKKLIDDTYSHDLAKLCAVAGLSDQLAVDRQANPKLDTSWSIIKDWRIESRYAIVDEASVANLHESAVDEVSGLLQWIRHFW